MRAAASPARPLFGLVHRPLEISIYRIEAAASLNGIASHAAETNSAWTLGNAPAHTCEAGSSPLAEHDEQIQRIRLGEAEHGQNRMRLAAMVRLVIEEVGEYLAQRLPLRSTVQGAIVQRRFEVTFRESCHEAEDTLILGLSRRVQRREILEQDRIELVRMIPATGHTSQPDSIPDQYVVQRTVRMSECTSGVFTVR